MDLKDTDLVQLIWDEINALTPEERHAEYVKIEKSQPAILKFLHEELDGLDHVYSDHVIPWLNFCFRGLRMVFDRKRLPKVNINTLHEVIEKTEGKVSNTGYEDYAETTENILLIHIVDHISHLDRKSKRGASEVAEDEEFELEHFEPSEYGDYEIEEDEGDEDYIMFREMYDEHDDSEHDEDQRDHDSRKYTLFLIFATVFEVMLEKLEA
ncbi:hypothetical protein ACFL4W_01040 [Planctomycetota bacterium]